MNCFSEEQLSRITHLVREIEELSDVEKLFLYLQLPCGRADASDVNSKQSAQRFNGATSTGQGTHKSLDLFSKKPDQETTQTYTWILSHLEIDPNVSLPKQEVYDEYRAFCQANRFEPLCVADFGKAMKHAFPCIKPRRLGQRGNSRYCYSGLRKKYKIQPPNLPDIQLQQQQQQQGNCDSEQIMYCTMTNCDTSSVPVTNNNTSGSNSSGNNTSSSSCSNNNNNNNSNSFNGNNMTVNSNKTEYPQLMANKRTATNYNRPEVMNLKIEPSTSGVIQFTEEPKQQQQQQVSYLFQTHHHPQQPHHTQQQQQHHQHHHHHQQQQQHSAATSSASSYDGSHNLGGGSHNQHHLPHQQHHGGGRYTTDYCSSRTIQQPGTPDDDDYRHNYQDVLPLSGHFLTNSSSHLQSAPQASMQICGGSGSSGTGFAYSHQQQQQQARGFAATSCVATIPTTSAASSMMHHQSTSDNDNNNNNNKYISNVLQSQAPFNTTTVPASQSNSGQQTPIRPAAVGGPLAGGHLLSHPMSVTHSMDACASPFQSPASTPYPSMSASTSQLYPIQDMMQEYCSSGCRLYQST